MLPNIPSGNRALTKLNISNNNIEQGQTLQQITECCSTKGVELKSLANEAPLDKTFLEERDGDSDSGSDN
jgi:hypothetical protein